MRYLPILFIAISLFPGCKQMRCECGSSAYKLSNDSILNKVSIDSAEFFTGKFSKHFSMSNPDPRFGFHFLTREDTLYLMFMHKSDTLELASIFEPDKSRKIYTGDFFHGKADDYCLNVIHDTLHLINNRTYTYCQFKIDSAFHLDQIFNLNLADFINFKNLFVNGDLFADKRVYYSAPYLLLPYGHFKKKNNADKTALFAINIQTKQVKRMLPYPQRYKVCDTRVPYFVMESDVPGRVVAVYQKDDRLYGIDPTANIIDDTSSHPSFTNAYMCYDKKNVSNLSYTQKIDLNDETNVNLIYIEPFFFTFKQLRRESKYEPLKASILLYDKNLQYIGAFSPQKTLSPRLSFSYKNGVAIFNDSLTRFYHYVLVKK